MIFPAILAALIALIGLILANEFVFGGTLFDSEPVGTIGGLAVLAAAIGTRVLQQHRGQGSIVLRNVAIWMAILTALVFGYWLFGRP